MGVLQFQRYFAPLFASSLAFQKTGMPFGGDLKTDLLVD